MSCIRKTAVLIALAMFSFSCNPNNIQGNIPVNNNFISKVIPITGKVEFPLSLDSKSSSFTISATLQEVGTSAMVALIYPSDYIDQSKRNVTIATGLTDANGTFLINPSSAFQPGTGDIFVLEANRRIGASGYDLISVRTLIKWTGSGWDSITYPGIMINPKTTALSILSDFNQDNLKSNDLIHKLQVISGQVQLTDITSSAGYLVSSDVVSYVETLVTKSIANNLDPIFEISCDSLVCKLKNDVIPGEYIIKKGQYAPSYDWNLFLADPNLQISQIGDSSNRLYLVKLRNSYANIFKYDKLFEFREGNVLLSTSPVTDPAQPPADILNPDNYSDTNFTKQYALEKTEAVRGWDITTGGGQVIVAVIDTGIDYTHEDFGCAGVSPVTPDNQLATECRLSVPSKWKNFTDKSNITNDPMDTSGHGTHVAGIIAAVANNGKGIAGLANNPNIKIMPVKVGNNPLSIPSSVIADGIIWAANNGADVINLSLGGPPSKVIEDAVNYAITQKGKYVVAAAGNNCSRDGNGNDRANYCTAMDYPASYRGVTAVGASDRNDNIWNTGSNGSQYPPNIITLTAPGDKIYSTLPGNQYGYKSGTSMAAPFVSALAAMLKYQNPTFNKEQIHKRIIDNCNNLGEPDRDDKFGWGRINVFKSLLGNNLELSAPNLLAIPVTGIPGNYTAPLNWNAVSGTEYYKLYKDGNFLVKLTGVTSYSDSGLTNLSHSYYVMACSNTLGCSEKSIVRTPYEAPSLPVLNDIQITGVNNTWDAILNWSSSTGTTNYKVFRNGVLISTVSGTSYIDPDLSDSSNSYFVSACNSYVCSNNSNEKTANEPPYIGDFLVGSAGYSGSVSTFNDGSFIMLRDFEEGSNSNIYGKRFDNHQNLIGTEFKVNTTSIGSFYSPKVDVSDNNNFVTVWEGGLNDDIYAQIYTGTGTKIGSEFRVNTYTNGEQHKPAVATDSEGNFVIAWESYGQENGLYGNIYAQRLSKTGTKIGSEILVNTYTTNGQSNSSIGMDDSGNFVVVWSSVAGNDGSYYGVFGQKFDSNGNRLGSEFQVNSYTSLDQLRPSISMNSSGNYVVSWESQNQDNGKWGIYAQRYDSSNNKVGSEFKVNTDNTSLQKLLSNLSLNDNGDFVVTWVSSGQDGSNDGIFAQRFDSFGNKAGTEFLVNSYTTGNQSSPSVSLDNNGNFVITWKGAGSGGNGVYGKRFNRNGLVY